MTLLTQALSHMPHGVSTPMSGHQDESIQRTCTCKKGGHAIVPDPTPSTTKVLVSGVGNDGSPDKEDSIEGNDEREWPLQGVRLKEGHEDQERENRKSKNQRLTDRDRELLKLILEQQFVTSEHVHTFFGDVKHTTVRRRLRAIAEMRFIEEEIYPEVGQKRVIRLTARGLVEALQQRGRYLSYKRDLSPMTLNHDILVTSLRLMLTEVWEGSFVPERAIKDHGLELIPDGLWVFPSGRFFALELENSDKGPKRFLRLTERWQKLSAPNLLGVLYFASSGFVLRSLQRSFERIPASPPMGLIDYQALAESRRQTSAPPSALTQKGALEIFKRRAF
jgi:hypothetical protein